MPCSIVPYPGTGSNCGGGPSGTCCFAGPSDSSTSESAAAGAEGTPAGTGIVAAGAEAAPACTGGTAAGVVGTPANKGQNIIKQCHF